MNELKHRLIFNTIGLGFVSFQLASAVLDTLYKHPSGTYSYVPLMFSMWIVTIFGCVLSIIDYWKKS